MSDKKSKIKSYGRPSASDSSPYSNPFGGDSSSSVEILYGHNAVKEALKNPHRKVTRLMVTDTDKLKDLSLTALKNQPEIVIPRKIESCIPAGSVHQGVALVCRPLNAPSLEDIIECDKGVFVVLDQVTDPQNVGAILRSCAAFGVKGIIVQERSSPSVSGLIAKVASGGVEHVPLIPVKNLSRTLEQFAKAGFWNIGLAGDTDNSLEKIKLPEKVVFVLGAEGSGLRRMVREHCDMLVRIPMSPMMESLNVSNATAIVLFEYFRQQGIN